jgi:hypothetical protein
MDLAIQICSYVIGLSLQLLAIAAFLRGGYRRYPFGFAYLIIGFLTAVAEIPASIAYYYGNGHNKLYIKLYWVDDGVREVLLFSVVISLIYIATSRLDARRMVRLSLISGAVLFVGLSFAIHYNYQLKIGQWMTPWTRDMKVCATILDLALWALLIGSKKSDQQLLLLSGALGIKFSGNAIGESIRTIANRNQSHGLATMGGTLGLIADFVFLFIWWQALRRQPVSKPFKATPVMRES